MVSEAIPATCIAFGCSEACLNVSKNITGDLKMGIEIFSVDGGSRVRIDGDFTIYEVEEYKDELKKSSRSLCSKNKNVELDLSGINEIDTSGLQLLATLAKQAKSKDCLIKIMSVNETAKEAIKLSGFLDLFNGECEGEC